MKTDSVKNFGVMLKSARQRAQLTLSELVERLGWGSPSSFSELENGRVKNLPSPDEVVGISDALRDRQLLEDWCAECPVRKRIVVKKFTRMNNIVAGVFPALRKTTQKIAAAGEAMNAMADRLCSPNFCQDPEYREYRNEFFLRVLEAKNGLEIVMEQAVREGMVSQDELRLLMEIHKANCIGKGYIVEEGA